LQDLLSCLGIGTPSGQMLLQILYVRVGYLGHTLLL